MKKYTKYINLIILLLVFSSCEDFLTVDPVSEIGSNGFYSNEAEVEAGVIAMYDGMQEVVNIEYAVTEMRSDNGMTKTHEGAWAQFENMNVEATNVTVSDYWSACYNTIFRTNTVLENLVAVEGTDVYAIFEGEAKFLRALCHFNLVRAFGDVPILDKVVNQNETEYFGRDSKAEVYDFIVGDLTDAIASLPGRTETQEGRATVAAAQALLAKVYLELKDYSSAKSLLDAVIANADYGLMDNYNDIFYSEMNKEIIFAIQFINDSPVSSQGYSYNFTWAGRAGGLNYGTSDLTTLVDPASHDGVSAFIDLTDADVTDKRFHTLFHFEVLGNERYECAKFRTDAASPEDGGGNDWIILRYADVLLMQAEAIIGGGTSTSDATALKDVNDVRARAGLDPIASLTKQNLLDERRVELAFENQRLFDLVRFGEAVSVMTEFANSIDAGVLYKFTATDLLLPIPQREMNLSDEIEQNPGY